MNTFRHRQRGEGKIGCIVSLLVLVTCAAVGYKAVPVFWTNNELQDAAKDLATRASVTPVESIELQVRTKAKDLDIAEATAKGAIRVSKRGDGQQGMCSIRLRYDRKIDLYGVYTWTVVTDKEVTAPYISGL
jgi:hypothetical protein